MGGIFKAWTGMSLIVRIVIGLLIGITVALFAPKFTIISVFGKVFVGLLKSIAPILVFVLVISALTNANGRNEKRGKTGGTDV